MILRLAIMCLAFACILGAWYPSRAAELRSPATDSPTPTSGPPVDREEFLQLYGMFAEAVAQVEMNYARPVDRRKLFESAIEGMLRDLDPYSAYLSPEKLSDYERRFSDQSDAADQATILGASRVNQSEKSTGAWDYVIREEPKIAYVAIVSFTKSTPRDLAIVLKQLIKNDVEGVVLDLRFNAGGLLTSAVDTADLLLDEGKIVSTVGRASKSRTWTASDADSFPNLPLAVLINHQSASGAEVLAAALQDNARAAIVGERSWGKGSVQNVFELDEGRSAVKLTTAAYHRPSGVNIHRFPGMTEDEDWGVKPDAEWTLSLPASESQAILDHRKTLIEPVEEVKNADSENQEPVVDRQLDLAVKAVLARLDH